MDRQMDGQRDEWIYRWMDRQMDGQIDAWIDKYVYLIWMVNKENYTMDRQMDGQRDEWIYKWMDILDRSIPDLDG